MVIASPHPDPPPQAHGKHAVVEPGHYECTFDLVLIAGKWRLVNPRDCAYIRDLGKPAGTRRTT